MFPQIQGSTDQYLADLDRTQQQINQAESEVSSGLSVEQPSDDPGAVPQIFQLQADIASNQQIQTNLGNVTTEVDTADSVLQNAVSAVESAISIAAQGATSTATADQRQNLAQQVAALQQTIVGISQTTVNGRYIFSGDQDQQPAYELDSTQPDGVKQLITAPSTRMIVDGSGTSIAVAKTAQEIFDARNSDGSVASGNVFAALNDLKTALLNNDQAGITQASDELNSADDYLNQQVTFYGVVEDQLTNATTLAQKFQTEQQTNLSQLRDADVPTVALQLSQLQVQQEAALSSEASIQQARNLFDYIA